ncbi:MAG: hypothetical protein AABY22_07255 [Nanoarchaeota archaeon]
MSLIFILLVVLLLVGNIFLTISLSLMYGNVRTNLKPYLTDLVEEKFAPNQINKFYDAGIDFCRGGVRDKFVIQTVLFPSDKYASPELSLTCDELSRYTNDTVINAMLEKAIYFNYFGQQDLECSWFSCVQTFTENPLVLLSKQSKDFFVTKFFIFFFLSLVLLVLTFFLFENKKNFFIYLGLLLIIGSLSPLLISKIALFLNSTDAVFLKLFSTFFSQGKKLFVILLALGLVSLGFGIISEEGCEKGERG